MADRSEQGSSDVNRDIEGVYPICLARAATDCGEGPFWSVDHSGLYWVDITGGRLHFYDPHLKVRHGLGSSAGHWLCRAESVWRARVDVGKILGLF